MPWLLLPVLSLWAPVEVSQAKLERQLLPKGATIQLADTDPTVLMLEVMEMNQEVVVVVDWQLGVVALALAEVAVEVVVEVGASCLAASLAVLLAVVVLLLLYCNCSCSCKVCQAGN